MSYRYDRYERYREQPRSQWKTCLIWLTAGVWLLVLLCVGVRYVMRPFVTDYINGRIAQAIDPALPSGLDPNAALRESLEQVPINVQVPPGEIEVTEEQANVYIEDYRQRLQGIDDIRVRFVPGEVQAIVTVRGISGTARMQPVVQDGRIVAMNPRLDEPLGSILSVDQLLGALQDRINSELNSQGRRIAGVRVEQGVAIVTVE